MYAHKDARPRPRPRSQTRDVLLRGAAPSASPSCDAHLDDVAELAVRRRRASSGSTPRSSTTSRRAAELHDIGKIAIPDAILHKPGPLDDDEWELMRQHTIIGERILAAAPALRAGRARSCARATSAGTAAGYPDGLAGEEIPLGARIIAVCDAFDAMTSERPYARARSADADALAELRALRRHAVRPGASSRRSAPPTRSRRQRAALAPASA